mmetsp:Transcript_20770/g.47139  ORF Transcript_20770/g.47139 Transcript_20770/m.47139 type:complete len:129 (-) Transcript_20770:978-1364(-)
MGLRKENLDNRTKTLSSSSSKRPTCSCAHINDTNRNVSLISSFNDASGISSASLQKHVAPKMSTPPRTSLTNKVPKILQFSPQSVISGLISNQSSSQITRNTHLHFISKFSEPMRLFHVEDIMCFKKR